MRNLAQRVTSGYWTKEEFRISTRPSVAGSEAPASVAITFILRATLRWRRKEVKISTGYNLAKLNLGVGDIKMINSPKTPSLT